MILADKIMEERKKCGFSQEELAEKLGVSRQSVSKWEGAQSTPDLQRILQMSELFDVTTDYLLIDSKEKDNLSHISNDTETFVHKVSMEQANEYLSLGKNNANFISLGVFLCIFSADIFISFGALFSNENFTIPQNILLTLTFILSFLGIAIAVSLFIFVGFKNSPYQFLKKEPIDLAYGVAGLIKEKKAQYAPIYLRNLITGVTLCIVGAVPFFLSGFFEDDSNYIFYILLFTAFFLIACGVYLIVKCVTTQNSFERLLQQGSFSPKEKRDNSLLANIAGIYWTVTTTIYLAFSFITSRWEITWIIWPIAGILFGVVVIIVNMINEGKQK